MAETLKAAVTFIEQGRILAVTYIVSLNCKLAAEHEIVWK